MSLLYTDPGNDDRSTPSVQSSDVHLNPKAHATDSIAMRAENTSAGGKIVMKNDTIIVYDATNQRIVIGRLPNGDYGIVVSRAGYNVSDIFS
jgi:hypothetical protein